MTEHREGPGAHGERDIDIKAIAWFGVAFVLVAILAHVGLWGLYEVFRSQARAKDDPALSLVQAQERELLRPPLQDGVSTAGPVDEMVKWRAIEARGLEEYGWVDREAGVVRIPVARAMQLVAERGLPSSVPQVQGGDDQEQSAETVSPGPEEEVPEP